MIWNIDTVAVIFAFIICAIFSGVLLSGKGGGVIAGYNMLSPEKKAKINEPKLCRFMGKIMFLITCAVLLLFIYLLTELELLMTISLILIAFSSVTALVWANVYYMAPLRK